MDMIEKAIKLLQDNEPLEGYHFADGGGKDSCVTRHIIKKSGVKHTSHFGRTSVDPPELLKFIKEYHPDTIWHTPKMTMYQLILKKKFLPSRTKRFCCQFLKEYLGIGKFVITGVRRSESLSRSKRKQIELNRKGTKLFIHPIFYWSDTDVWN